LSVLRGDAARIPRDAKGVEGAAKWRLCLAAGNERPQTNAEQEGSRASGEKRFEAPLMIVRAPVCRLRPKAPQKASKNGPVY
jgi:hypothetical protein